VTRKKADPRNGEERAKKKYPKHKGHRPLIGESKLTPRENGKKKRKRTWREDMAEEKLTNLLRGLLRSPETSKKRENKRVEDRKKGRLLQTQSYGRSIDYL